MGNFFQPEQWQRVYAYGWVYLASHFTAVAEFLFVNPRSVRG